MDNNTPSEATPITEADDDATLRSHLDEVQRLRSLLCQGCPENDPRKAVAGSSHAEARRPTPDTRSTFDRFEESFTHW